MLVKTVAFVLSALPLASAQGCAADNCFRAVQNYQAKTAGFCGAYLASATAAPSPFATCGPTRLSSACNCLTTATATATATAVTTTSTTTSTTTATTFSTSTTSAAASATPVNLVVNGGFESGNLSPWVTTIADSGFFRVVDNSQSSEHYRFRARTGVKLLQFGNSGYDEHDTISQPVSLTAGKRYAFNAYYSVLAMALDTCYLSVTIGGTQVASDVIYSSAGVGNPPRYWKIEGTYIAPATTTSDLTIDFSCGEDSVGGAFGLDDISLV